MISMVCLGAGISVQAGIPDFRSETGLFQTLKKENSSLSSGRDLFDASVFNVSNLNPVPLLPFTWLYAMRALLLWPLLFLSSLLLTAVHHAKSRMLHNSCALCYLVLLAMQ